MTIDEKILEKAQEYNKLQSELQSVLEKERRNNVYDKLLRREGNVALTQEEIDIIICRLACTNSEASDLFAWLHHEENSCFNKELLQEKPLSLKFLLRVGVSYCETPEQAFKTIRLLRMHTGIEVNVLIDV